MGISIADLFNDPRTMGELPDADVAGQEGIPGEGPFMRMYLKFQGEQIRTARFETYNCPYAVACGSWVTRWVEGRTIAQASVLETEDVSRILGGLPLAKEHCASLAVKSLRAGLQEWQELRKEEA